MKNGSHNLKRKKKNEQRKQQEEYAKTIYNKGKENVYYYLVYKDYGKRFMFLEMKTQLITLILVDDKDQKSKLIWMKRDML